MFIVTACVISIPMWLLRSVLSLSSIYILLYAESLLYMIFFIVTSPYYYIFFEEWYLIAIEYYIPTLFYYKVIFFPMLNWKPNDYCCHLYCVNFVSGVALSL